MLRVIQFIWKRMGLQQFRGVRGRFRPVEGPRGETRMSLLNSSRFAGGGRLNIADVDLDAAYRQCGMSGLGAVGTVRVEFPGVLASWGSGWVREIMSSLGTRQGWWSCPQPSGIMSSHFRAFPSYPDRLDGTYGGCYCIESREKISWRCCGKK